MGEWNWAIAVVSARYNAKIVESVFSKWPRNQPVTPPLHEIIFCATNLAFATELYLKAACVACSGTPPPNGHNLLKIFKNLPKLDRDKILQTYEGLNLSKYGQLENGEVWLRLNDGDLPNETRPTNLMEVLDHYSTSYEDWRYIFALHKKASTSNLRALHYSRLMCLCEAIDSFLQSRFPDIVRKDDISIS
jgi:hypothetical protein